MKLESYKILSVVFIVIGLLLVAGVLVFFRDMPTGQKIVFAACVAVLVGAMAYNVKVISKKQKGDKSRRG